MNSVERMVSVKRTEFKYLLKKLIKLGNPTRERG